MTSDEAFGFELLAAVEALSPDAAPLAAALVRGGCIVVPRDTYASLLAVLDSRSWGDTIASNLLAQVAMLAAWRGSQARVDGGQVGAPDAWQALADMGLWQQACAAVVFGSTVASASMHLIEPREPGQLLH